MKIEGFKLLAIRPLPGCAPNVLKNLNEGEIYQFYQDYEFFVNINGKKINSKNLELKDYFDKNIVLVKAPENETDLYSDGVLKINISAVVGKNGSGKSTILEILYLISLSLSKKQPKIQKELKNILKRNAIIGNFVLKTLDDIDLELFYVTPSNEKNEIRSVRFVASKPKKDNKGYENSRIEHFQFNESRKKSRTGEFRLEQFCYSIALNYSLYGLNERESPWLKPLFHKNDGYQAPLVINPYRENGNIDVNTEFDLSNYRLMQNIAESANKEFELINKKFVEEIDLTIDLNSLFKFKWGEYYVNIYQSKVQYENDYNSSVYDLINEIINAINSSREELEKKKIEEINKEKIEVLKEISFKGVEFVRDEIFNNKEIQSNSEYFNTLIEFLFFEYLIKKIFKIYLHKVNNPNLFNTNGNGEIFKEFTLKLNNYSSKIQLIKEIVDDRSHQTLKFRQVLFLWDSYFFNSSRFVYTLINKKKDYSVENKDFKLQVSLNLIELESYMNLAKSKGALDLEVVPGGIFVPTIKYKSKEFTTKNIDLTTLSSGETQFLFSIHTVLYHLRNINSVKQSGNNDLILFKNVNLIFDEIELYFHPEFQRNFIVELLRNINNLDIPNIKNLNIIFSTHSPFFLSDIPSNNILRLEEGEVSKKQFSQTFGANIHELLANDFFLENGFMGEFAKKHIEGLIDKIANLDLKSQDEKLYKRLKSEIELIGEPVLQNSLISMLDSKFEKMLVLNDRKKELEIELERIKNLMKN